MADFASILDVSIGTAAFQASKVSVSDKPVNGTSGNEVGRQIAVTIEGWCAGADAAAYAAAVVALEAALSTRGNDLVIKGLGGATLFSLLAAQCLDGGPFIEWTGRPDGALRSSYTLTVKASKGGSSSTEQPDEQVTLTTDQSEAGTQTLRAEAEYTGINALANSNALVAQYRAAYPWPNWAVRTSVQEEGNKLKTRMEIKPLVNALFERGGVRAVDWTRSLSTQVNESGTVERVLNFDVLCDGDPMQIEAAIRPTDAVVVSSSIEVTEDSEQRLRASYRTISSDYGDGILEFVQRFEVTLEEAIVQPRDYDGQVSVLVWKQGKVMSLRQTGRLVALRRMFKPPLRVAAAGFYPSIHPRVSMGWIDAWRTETTWEYEQISVGQSGMPTATMLEGLRRGNGEVAI